MTGALCAPRSTRYAKPEDGLRPVRRAGAEDCRGEVGVVRRIGEMLRLQDQRPAVNVHVAGFADDRAVEEIARVELNARLRRAEVERAASRRLDDACRVGQAS